MVGALAGCAAVRAPVEILELPRTPTPQGAEWPRLVDGPAPDAGEAGPDPEEGRRIAERLSVDAAAGATEAERLAAPVIPPAQSARLQQAAGG